MTSDIGKVRVKIGGMSMALPVYMDMETTAKIVAEVEKRLATIDKKSNRVNTQEFALQAAYEFAVERYDLDKKHREETGALIKALDQLATQLKHLVSRFHILAPSSGEQDS